MRASTRQRPTSGQAPKCPHMQRHAPLSPPARSRLVTPPWRARAGSATLSTHHSRPWFPQLGRVFLDFPEQSRHFSAECLSGYAGPRRLELRKANAPIRLAGTARWSTLGLGRKIKSRRTAVPPTCPRGRAEAVCRSDENEAASDGPKSEARCRFNPHPAATQQQPRPPRPQLQQSNSASRCRTTTMPRLSLPNPMIRRTVTCCRIRTPR